MRSSLHRHIYLKFVTSKVGLFPHKHNVHVTPPPFISLSKCFSTTTSSQGHKDKFPSHAEIVICGSGLMGNSVAYHLAKRGVKGIVILQLPGHLGNFQGTASSKIGCHLSVFKCHFEGKVINKSISLYKHLQEEFDVGFQVTGGLYVAQEGEMMTAFQRRKDILEATSNIKSEILTPSQIKERFPMVHTDDLKGAIVIHDDAVANPHLVIKALQASSVAEGVQVVPNCHFNKVLVDGGKVVGVETTDGIIKCEKFVNCAGWFAWEYGQKNDPPVRIPCHAVERHYLKTKPLPLSSKWKEKLPKTFPTVFDMNAYTYVTRLPDDSFVIAAYEKRAKPLFTKGLPENWILEMTPDFDHFASILDASLKRIPLLKDLEVDKLTCEPDSFSPDGRWIIGETAEIKRYYVAAATNGNPLQLAGGVGHFLAHWIVTGERHAPLLQVDIQRFVDVHNCRNFLRDRVSEVVGKQLEVHYPNVSQYSTARRIRCSPLHATLHADYGAVFGESMSFEYPLYFDEQAVHDDNKQERRPETTFRKPPYFDELKTEYQAVTNAIGVNDCSSYSKFVVSSPQNQVVQYLQKVCSNNVDIEIGSVVPTGMQNNRGGYEADCILGRMAENKYFIWSVVELQTRIPFWMQTFLPADNSVEIYDVTSKFCLIEVAGPKCMEVINELAHRDMKMPRYRFKVVNFAYAPEVTVMTFCQSAVFGCTLSIPSEYALHVYKQIMEVGKVYGIKNYGSYVQRSLRVEKCIAFWGSEVYSSNTPVEIGRMNRVDLSKDFIGKKAIVEQLKNGVKQRLVYFSFCREEFSVDTDVFPRKGEPIYRNGVFVGQCTTATYGYGTNQMRALAFITNPNKETGQLDFVTKDYIMNKEAIYQMVLASKRFKIHPSLFLKARVS